MSGDRTVQNGNNNQSSTSTVVLGRSCKTGASLYCSDRRIISDESGESLFQVGVHLVQRSATVPREVWVESRGERDSTQASRALAPRLPPRCLLAK